MASRPVVPLLCSRFSQLWKRPASNSSALRRMDLEFGFVAHQRAANEEVAALVDPAGPQTAMKGVPNHGRIANDKLGSTEHDPDLYHRRRLRSDRSNPAAWQRGLRERGQRARRADDLARAASARRIKLFADQECLSRFHIYTQELIFPYGIHEIVQCYSCPNQHGSMSWIFHDDNSAVGDERGDLHQGCVNSFK